MNPHGDAGAGGPDRPQLLQMGGCWYAFTRRFRFMAFPPSRFYGVGELRGAPGLGRSPKRERCQAEPPCDCPAQS